MLHGRGIEIAADLLQQRFAGVAIVTEHANLDELVGKKIDVDLVQDRRREAVLSNRHDRMKRMRLRPEGAPLGGC